MCGILGGTDLTWDFNASLSAMAHRGPDSRSLKYYDKIVMGFNRLAVVDLHPQADQPMVSPDGFVRIVFNGEIYGFHELKECLIIRGHLFRTNSDTEVLLHAYLEWGDSFVDHLNGMFAVAIVDAREQRLKLFRDHAGIKPLFYFYDGKDFAFASELKAITALCQNVHFQMDATAVYDYMNYRYIPDPKTLYKNVFKLLPAHQLTFDLVKNVIVALKPYWRLQPDPSTKFQGIGGSCEHLRALLKEVVQEQIVADVPLGCFLSGGVDSSIVTTLAAGMKPGVEAFSMGFDAPEYSELLYAKEVARIAQAVHFSRVLPGSDIGAIFPMLKTLYDEPFADTSALPTFLLSKLARERVTVVLTGDGADEIFGGYSRYQKMAGFAFLPYFKGQVVRDLAELLGRTRLSRINILRNIFKFSSRDLVGRRAMFMMDLEGQERNEFRKKLGVARDYDDHWYYRKYDRPDLPLKTRLQYMDFHTFLPADILTKVDRASMAVSLEARVPFLDKRIIEFAFNLPEDIRYYNGQSKGVLKEAFRAFLPDPILNRKKQGFNFHPDQLPCAFKDLRPYILEKIFNISRTS